MTKRARVGLFGLCVISTLCLNNNTTIKINKPITACLPPKSEMVDKFEFDGDKEFQKVQYKLCLEEKEKQRILQQKTCEQQVELKRQKELKTIKIELSFYTNNCIDCGKNDAISKSGKKLDESYVYCAAPPDIPFGTIISIKGFGDLIVVDRGRAIHYKYDQDGNKIMKLDVFVLGASEEFLNSKGIVKTTGVIK